MKLNEYFDKAMTTNKEASDNITYSVMGLTAEVGEINDKIAKWRRKGIANIDNNRLVFTTANEVEVPTIVRSLPKRWAMCFGLWHTSADSSAIRSTMWRR